MGKKPDIGHREVGRRDPERNGYEFLGHAYSDNEAKNIIKEDKRKRKILGLN